MTSLKIPIIDKEGKITEGTAVSWDFKEAKNSRSLLAQAVRVFLSNQRKARAKAKSRGEVQGSTAKIWRQKGTGRARHGSRKAPIFVGGGVAHGPTGGQNYSRKLSQKMREKSLLTVLLGKIKGKKILLTKDLEFKKTKEAQGFLEKVRQDFFPKGKIAFLVEKNDTNRRSIKNLPAVSVLSTEALNTYLLLRNDLLLLSENGLKSLEKRFSGKEIHARSN